MSDPVARLNAALEGRHRIERELGEGGMATVYLADDLKHERKVALKVLAPRSFSVAPAFVKFIHTVVCTFSFSRNRLPGSYLFLISTSRS